MNVYSSTIDVSTLCAPLEALKASEDQIILIQICCTEISTRCTQICIPNFRYQLYNNGMSNFNYKGRYGVADDLYFTEIILEFLYDVPFAIYNKNTDTIKIS